jgi:phosphate transport system permease protein
VTYPKAAVGVERREWGNFYGFLKSVKEDGKVVALGGGEHDVNDAAWPELEVRLQRALDIHHQIKMIEKGDIGKVNYELERLRLRQRSLELKGKLSAEKLQFALAEINAERAEQDKIYKVLQQNMERLYADINRDSVVMVTTGGKEVEISFANMVRAYRPNAMSTWEKLAEYFSKLWEFLSDDPREANTEGGIFPAIFGTVMMVLLMSILVTPFGVVAAVYLREYAKQGTVTQMVRIAVNNLAGVPSIVYGVFGLGFFIYFIGSAVDQTFFAASLPAPTFGTPGLMWASLTLALLTLPVVIVATEEGLARIPRSVREGSLALGATKAETLWRVVLPMASPAMMTGLILAVARAAGEVAPLMLVGVVKLAPSLPLDGNYPFVHLERKFMHLGFHIYDVGFQSPNVEAARPLVYATAFLLVVVIALLNFSAVSIRNRLREKYKALEH